jgi:hypothetical protein
VSGSPVMLQCMSLVLAQSLPRRPRASVSVIRCLAAALVPWPARQLMTHFGSGGCIAARPTIALGQHH